MPFTFHPTALPDVIEVQPRLFRDDRGFFMETWNHREFSAAGIPDVFVQDNHSRSTGGTLRGLHYQVDRMQGKLVRVLAGRIFDVVVDVRRNSPTLGQWGGVELSAERGNQLWIPRGYAHGFYVLSESADIAYKCTDFYVPECEVTLRWDDPAVGVRWPIPAGASPTLSPKDSRGKAWDTVPLCGDGGLRNPAIPAGS